MRLKVLRPIRPASIYRKGIAGQRRARYTSKHLRRPAFARELQREDEFVFRVRRRLGEGRALLDARLLAAEEVYEDELREVAGRGEVGLARSHLRHLLDELDEVVV